MGNKKKHIHTDPTLSMIRDIFQENLQIVNRVQRKSKSDIVTRYDLTEKLCARRMKAVTHLMPEMQEQYATTYPEIDIVSEFADIASLPILSHDSIDIVLYIRRIFVGFYERWTLPKMREVGILSQAMF